MTARMVAAGDVIRWQGVVYRVVGVFAGVATLQVLANDGASNDYFLSAYCPVECLRFES